MTKNQRLLLTGLTVVGLSTLTVAWALNPDDFLPALLVEVGAAVFLFGGLYVLETFLDRRVTRVEETTQDLSAQVEDVREELKQTRAALDAVGEDARRAIKSQRMQDQGALDELDDDVSHSTVRRLLERALRLKAISESGVRVKMGGTDARLAFVISDEGVELVLQRFHGEMMERFHWTPDDSAAEVMARVAEGLVRTHDYSEHAFDATAILKNLQGTVAVAFESRWGERETALAPVIEIPNDQWAVTESGLECLENDYYVDAPRLLESDWPVHMSRKDWVDLSKFEEALAIGAALFKSDMNRYYVAYWD